MLRISIGFRTMSAGFGFGWAAVATNVAVKTKTAAAVLFNDDLRHLWAHALTTQI